MSTSKKHQTKTLKQFSSAPSTVFDFSTVEESSEDKKVFTPRVLSRVTKTSGLKTFRTHSSQGSPRTFRSPPKHVSLYKTELCRVFERNGECQFGENCDFAHGLNELKEAPRHSKYRTRPCKLYSETGICPYGSRCSYIHDANISAAPSSNYSVKGISQLKLNLNLLEKGSLFAPVGNEVFSPLFSPSKKFQSELGSFEKRFRSSCSLNDDNQPF